MIDPCSTEATHATPADIHSRIEALRTIVVRLDPDATAERLVAGVSEAVERLMVEHAGLAEELLSVYEQIGIIFEVTRRLPNVESESDVVNLFVDSLRRSFQKHAIFVVKPDQLDANWEAGGLPASGDWLVTLVRRARDRATVLVEAPPAGTMPDCVEELLVGPVFAGDAFVCAIVLSRRPDLEAFRASDMLLLEALTTFCGDLIRNHRLVHEMREMCLAVVRSLVNAVDQKDCYTSRHSFRVGYFAMLLGETLTLDNAELQMLGWSALLHDIGKIGIRDDVLKKPGRLTDEEWNHIREHPVRSHEVVAEVPQLANAFDGILHHHERFDGSGYPAGLAATDIPLQARIIQIADVFDALTSDRSYRHAHTWHEALDIMKEEAGKTIDPRLRELFDRLMHEMLDGDPDEWGRLVQRANQFTGAADQPERSTRRE